MESMAEGGLHWTMGVEIEVIVPFSLFDGVWPISEQVKVAIGSNEALLQMYLNFVTHLELLWHSMLIMALPILSIGFVQYIMDLLADVLNALNEVVSHADFRLHASRIYLSSYKWYGHINGT